MVANLVPLPSELSDGLDLELLQHHERFPFSCRHFPPFLLYELGENSIVKLSFLRSSEILLPPSAIEAESADWLPWGESLLYHHLELLVERLKLRLYESESKAIVLGLF